MKKILFILSASAALCSCASQYTIEGQASSSDMEGKMVFLKTVASDAMVSIDSCEIIHGNFSMQGRCDTVQLAELFLDNTPLMPLILEAVPLQVSINDTVMKVSGTELNENLYDFLVKKNELEASVADLPRKESRMIMDGKSEEEINLALNTEFQQLSAAYDRLVMEKITRNFDNMLSVAVFMIHTSNGQPPLMNAQIEDIMMKANDLFKNNTYVKAFLQAAETNERNRFNTTR